MDSDAALAAALNAGAVFQGNGQVILPNGKTIGKKSTGIVFNPLKDTIVLNVDKINQKANDTGKKFAWVMNHEIDHALQGFDEYRQITQPLREKLFGKTYVDADGVTLKQVNGVYSTNDLVTMFVNNYLRGKSYQQKENFAKQQGLWDYQNNKLDENNVAKYMQQEVMAETRSAGLFGKTRLNSARQNLADWALVNHENNMLARTMKNVFGLGGEALYTPATGAAFSPEQTAQARRNQIALERFNGVLSPHDGSDIAPQVKPSDIRNDRVLADHYAKDDGVFKTTKIGEVVDKDGNIVSTHILPDPNAYEGEWKIDPQGTGLIKTKGFGELPNELAGVEIPEGGSFRIAKQIVYGADGKPIEEKAGVRKTQRQQSTQIQRNILLDQSLLDPENPNFGMRATNAEGTSFRGVPTIKQLEAIFSLPENILPYSIKEKIGMAVGLINDGEGTPTIGMYSARLNRAGKYEAFSPKIHEGVQIGLQFSKDGHWLFTEFNKSGARDKANLILKYKPELLRLWDHNVDNFMADLSKYMKNWKNNPDMNGIPLDPVSEQAARMRHSNLDPNFDIAMQKRYIMDAFLNITNKDAQGRANYNPITIDLPKIPKSKMSAAEKDDARRSDPNSLIRARRVDAYSDLKPSAGTKMPLDYGKSLYNAMPEAQIPLDIEEKGKPAEVETKLAAGAVGRGIAATAQFMPEARIPEKTYTDDEISALKEYQSGIYNSEAGGYSNIQSNLRYGNIQNPAYWNEEIGKKHIQSLLSAFEKSPIEKTMTVYRGLRFKSGEGEHILYAKAGDILSDKGITSTTSDRDLADRKFQTKLSKSDKLAFATIKLPKGTKAIDVGSITGDSNESEVAIAPNVQFVVKSNELKNGVQHIKLEAVQENQVSAPDEKIVSATYVNPKTGDVSEGQSHLEANPNAPQYQTDRESPYYGFKTSSGRIVDRAEAYRIADSAGQLKQPATEDDKFNQKRQILHSNMVNLQQPAQAIQFMPGVDYILPKDPRQKMADFYMLSHIEHLLGPLSPVEDATRLFGLRSGGYEENVKLAKHTMMNEMKNHIMDSLLFSISAELRHALERQQPNDVMNTRFLKAYNRIYSAYASPNAGIEEKPRVARQFNKSNDSYRRSYEAVLSAMKDTDASIKEVANDAELLFAKGRWLHSYGGKPWADIADGLRFLNDAKQEKTITTAIDHAYDLEHNTATVFNKIGKYKKFGGYGWINQMLDFKGNIINMRELLPYVSPKMKKIAMYALKDDPASRFQQNVENNFAEATSPKFLDDVKMILDKKIPVSDNPYESLGLRSKKDDPVDLNTKLSSWLKKKLELNSHSLRAK
jgi:hypothetical protein